MSSCMVGGPGGAEATAPAPTPHPVSRGHDMTAAAIETLACYVPALVLRRLAAEPAMIARQVRVPAAVLFTDISGFTALTERLARGGPGGSETLSVLLNVYF